jgi:hypothetical protein
VLQRRLQIAAAVLAAALAGCEQRPAAQAEPPPASDAGYVAPPAVNTVTAAPDGGVRLSGDAPAEAPVRLATPEGVALVANADPAGNWSLDLPKAADARIFGLSARTDGRAVQAEGYLLVGPDGQVALLRSGASAVRLDRQAAPGIASLDLDAEGGGLLSGRAAPGTNVAVRLDGGSSNDVRADDTGRFSYTMTHLAPRPHRIEVVGVQLNETLAFDAAPPAPLVAGPLRSQLTSQGLRADWLTPGGGVQSTILANLRGAS